MSANYGHNNGADNGHNNGHWDDMPENLLRLPGPDAVLPDRMLAGILCGRPVRVGAPPEALALSDLVIALRRPALPDELHGEGAALAAYRQAMSTDDLEEEQVPRPLRPSVGPKIAAVALAASLGMGGVAAAAAGGSLPDPLQDIAHVLFGAPPAHSDSNDESDLGDTAPIPMPTDASTRSPNPWDPSTTSPTPLPTDSPTLEACTPEMAFIEPCGLVAQTEPDSTDLIEPDPTPTVSDLDTTTPTTPAPTSDESPEPGRPFTEHPTGVPSWQPFSADPPGAPSTLPGLRRPIAD